MRIDINGQVVDRQFRELVVRATNTGATPLQHVTLDVVLPESLPVIGNRQPESMDLETTTLSGGRRVYTYAIRSLAPGAAAVARFPFRTQSTPALEHNEVSVVARLGSATAAAEREF